MICQRCRLSTPWQRLSRILKSWLNMTSQLNQLSAAQVVQGIAAGEFSAFEVMQACLSRIEERENLIGAFVNYDPQGALKAARQADRASQKGLLQGVPFVAKDIIDTIDFPTEWGSTIYQGFWPRRNASCVEHFKRAGAIMVGKTVTTEFAYFKPGKTVNPANPEYTPGGSSSGSAAAVADAMVPLGFGSQTAASLIRPAAYCGVIGYKPTHGAFSLDGVMGLSPNLDTLGLLARHTEDIQLARCVLTGCDGLRKPDFDQDKPRVALMRGPHWDDGSIEMRDICQRALSKLADDGAQTGELTHPKIFNQLTECQKTVMAFEVARSRIFEYSQHGDQISSQFKALIESGLEISYNEYQQALALKSQATFTLDTLFMDVDVILAPAASGEAPHGLTATGDPLFSRGWNLLQVPCINIPFSTGPNGLPLSVQIIAPYGGDEKLLEIARWVENLLRE